MVKFVPITITALAGAGDGMVRRNDVQNGRANEDGSAIEGQFPFGTIFEALLALGGMGADMMRMFSSDITEPVIYAGTTLLGLRGGTFLSKQVITPPMVAAVPLYGDGARAQLAPAVAAALGHQESAERQFVLG